MANATSRRYFGREFVQDVQNDIPAPKKGYTDFLLRELQAAHFPDSRGAQVLPGGQSCSYWATNSEFRATNLRFRVAFE